MIRNYALAIVAVMLISRPAVGQAGRAPQPPATQPASQPAKQPTATPQEILDRVEQMLQTAHDLGSAGRSTQARAILGDAQRGLQIVLNADPRNVRAQVLAGELAVESGDENTGRTFFKGALDVEPGNFRANLGMGRFYVTSHLWRQAEAFLKSAERVAPPDRRGEVLRLLAFTYLNENRGTEAVATAQQAVAAAPTDLDSQQLLVQSLVAAEQFEKAVEAARVLAATAAKEREAKPSDATVLRQSIRACEIYAEALKRYHNTLYRRNARNEPTDELLPNKETDAAQVLSRIAHLTADLGDLRRELNHHDTLVYMEKAVEYQPNNTGYLLDLAGLLLATHQTDQAIEKYQRILEIANPGDADPAAASRNRETAKEFLERLHAPLTSQPAAAAEAAP